MDRDLTQEFLRMQQSRSGYKYVEMLDDYVRDIPERIQESVESPLRRINRNIRFFMAKRGRMVADLERHFAVSLRKFRKLKKRFK